MEEFICPRCKTSKFQNPSLKMMVNVCGHGLCESCVDLLFLKGSGSCPECRIPLRRNNFRAQMFEDANVEKEVDIRRRILRDYNKKEDDFATLADYNNYLEEIETLVYNLANNIDIINTNKKIEQYKRDNRDQIQKSKGKLGREEYELEEIIEFEKQQHEYRTRVIVREEVETKRRKIREKEALIDELMFSNANAKNIVETFAQQQQQVEEAPLLPPPPPKMNQFSSGIQFGRQSQLYANYLPIHVDEGPLYVYKPLAFQTDGPRPPTNDEIVPKGYTNHVRGESEQERAGGFKSNIACLRALQDALFGLYHVKKAPLVVH